jgi:hypothetical protein
MLCPRVSLTRRRGVDQIELRHEVPIPKDRKSVSPHESVRVTGSQEDVHAGRLKARLGVAIGSHPGPAEQIKNLHPRILSRPHFTLRQAARNAIPVLSLR